MAQGKLKVKSQLPKNVKQKSKGTATTKRANRPIQPKKAKVEKAQKLKQVITKALNKTFEEEIRAKAGETQKTLSKAQEAVANYHTKREMNSIK